MAFRTFHGAFLNHSQILALALAVLTTALLISVGGRSEMLEQANDWGAGVLAFIYVALGWAIYSLVTAPFLVIKEDRKRGSWHGTKRIYHEPLLVGVSVWTDQDADKVALVQFDDAEPNSLTSYVIELDPPVVARASSYLEPSPGLLDGLHSSIKIGGTGPNAGQSPKVGGRGSIRLNGVNAYLRVKLDPDTVPVTARVYMTGFDVSEI